MTDELTPLPEGPFASTIVSAALEMSQSTISTMGNRGLLQDFDFRSEGRGHVRQFSLLDVLTLALMQETARMRLGEMPTDGTQRTWAGHWLDGRGQAVRLHTL